MAIYYNNLFSIIAKNNICQAQLIRACDIGQSSFSRIRSGKAVSLNILQRICEYLHCNIGDIVSFVSPSKELQDLSNALSSDYSRMVIKMSLEDLMREKGYSLNRIAKICNLSINTVKSILAGRSISKKTYFKLMDNLGSDFMSQIKKKVSKISKEYK